MTKSSSMVPPSVISLRTTVPLSKYKPRILLMDSISGLPPTEGTGMLTKLHERWFKDGSWIEELP